MKLQLKDKVTVITGPAKGMGRAVTLAFAQEGATLVLAGRDIEAIEPVAAEARALGVDVLVVPCDMTDAVQTEALAAAAIQLFGRIDILVNSAGTNATQRNFDVLTTDAWDDVVGINLSGSFYCVHSVLPAMRAQQGGLIINVSSWAGLYASKLTGPAYNTTKRAVLALTESINMEECMHGIRATSLLPGEVATPIMEKRPTPPSQAQRDLMVQAQDMGQAILFLAQMPARTCINELVISPTHNRFYLGGLETPPART